MGYRSTIECKVDLKVNLHWNDDTVKFYTKASYYAVFKASNMNEKLETEENGTQLIYKCESTNVDNNAQFTQEKWLTSYEHLRGVKPLNWDMLTSHYGHNGSDSLYHDCACVQEQTGPIVWSHISWTHRHSHAKRALRQELSN